MIEPELCRRIEETNPTDRVRGTIVNVTTGLFVVKYDNGDYVAYDQDQQDKFHDAGDKPVPSHAAQLIHMLRKKHGTTPPEDYIGVLVIEDNQGIPHPRTHMSDAGKSTTEELER